MATLFNSPEEAAVPVCHLACARSIEGETGTYLHMRTIKPPSELALDPAAGAVLFDAAARMRAI